QAAKGVDSVRRFDPGDVIDVGRRSWDKTLEQVSAVTAEIEDCFHRVRNMLAKNCCEGAAALRQNFRREHAAIEFFCVPRLAAVAHLLVLGCPIAGIKGLLFFGIETRICKDETASFAS